jgi:hypothetical protein
LVTAKAAFRILASTDPGRQISLFRLLPWRRRASTHRDANRDPKGEARCNVVQQQAKEQAQRCAKGDTYSSVPACSLAIRIP